MIPNELRPLLERAIDVIEDGAHLKEHWDFAEELRAMLETPPADAADMGGQAGEEVEVVQYQCREIGETDWEECGIEGFNYCNRSPLHDTRTLMTVAQHQRITAAMAAEVERLKAEVTRWHTLACNHSRAEDQLRAELAEVKGREPALWFRSLIGEQCKPDGRCYDVVFSPCEGFMPLYTTPPASPDVAGLCRLLAQAQGMVNGATDQWHDEARDALSTWRQAQEVKP